LGLTAAGLIASPRFRVRRVEFAGLRRLKSGQLNRPTSAILGRNILLVSRRWLERAISREPGVAAARVLGFSRGTLRVAVREKEPMLWWPSKNGPMLMDEQGSAFEGAALPPKGAARLVGAKLDRAGRFSNNPQLASVMESVAALRKHHVYPSLVKVNAAGGVTAVTQDGVALKLGPAVELEEKCEVIEMALRALPSRRQIEYIDVSCPKAPAWKPKASGREH
jgi:cell division septal protein FtsQ